MSEQLEAAMPEQPKKSSGYRRLQSRHRALINDHEALRKSYQDLFTRQEAILAELQRKSEECEQLQSMYAALQSDVQIVLAENTKLIETIAVLRSNAVEPQPTYQPQPPYQPQRPATPPGLPSLFARGLR